MIVSALIIVLVAVIISFTLKNKKNIPLKEGGIMKILYSIILAVLLAFFVGLGIEAFYPTEKYPQPPASLEFKTSAPATAEEIKAQQDFEQELKEYRTRNAVHARNVSMIAVAVSIILLTLSLTILVKAADVFSDGFLLGSLLTLLYGIIRGFETEDNKFRFIIVSIGLLIALFLGYIKFVKQKNK